MKVISVVAIINGFFIVVFIISIIFRIIGGLDKPSYQHANNYKDFNDGTFKNKKGGAKFKSAENIEALKKLMVESYYNLEEEIEIRAYFLISVNEVIDILGNKKVFIFNNSFSCTTLQSYITDIYIKVTYTQGFRIFRAILAPILKNKLNPQDIEVYNKIKSIFNNIVKPEMTDLEKVRAVHDYLILTSRYDEENYKNNTIPEVSHTPYGLLFKNKAVCSAYAEVFMIFMTLASIECYYVVGNIKDTTNSMGHAWNIIRIKNHYYHIDVTFNNPVPDVIGRVKYDYFNLTDEKIGKTHIWNRNEYPACIASGAKVY